MRSAALKYKCMSRKVPLVLVAHDICADYSQTYKQIHKYHRPKAS